MPHLLFVPGAILMLNAGDALMLPVLKRPDFDAAMGGPTALGEMMFFMAVGGYFAALAIRRASRPSAGQAEDPAPSL